MKSFKSFKDYVFNNLFPDYYHANDTYKDSEGKGILERFIEVCSEYLDTEVMPDIDNFTDIIDIDETPEIFLNYLWEYFGYIPYAYGVLTRGEPYTKENVARWLNNPKGFPKADTRKILKYAISLYKIRCTSNFYTVLGRFYGVRFELYEVTSDPSSEVYEGDVGLIVATYANIGSTIGGIKGGYRIQDCWSCVYMKARVYIPQGMWELIQELGTENDVKKAFLDILNKYLPIYVKLFTDEDIELIPDMPVLLISSPPQIPRNTTRASILLPIVETPEIVTPDNMPKPKDELIVTSYNDQVVTYDEVRAGYIKYSDLVGIDYVEINGGSYYTDNPLVEVTLATAGIPTHYRVSEDQLFTNAQWIPWSGNRFNFTVSSDIGKKTIYVQVKNDKNWSNVEEGIVYLQESNN